MTDVNPFAVPLDALPYYDRDLDAPDQQHLRGEINALIAVELRSLLPTQPGQQPTNLTHLSEQRPLPSTSTLLGQELHRVQHRKPVPAGHGLDTTRYAMPAPTAKQEKQLGREQAWEQAYKSSLAQLEHQRLRTINGTLLQGQLGSNNWRVSNFAMENAVERVDKQVQDTRDTVEDVNRRRKRDQEKAGETLARLERRWTELVSGNLQLEIGTMAMEAEVAQLQARYAELQSRLQQTV
ncbi:hypothetical protein OIV83_002476 [Microbotryomycetes sp. JL201]|nr:hypothetical protein OIV83_002476 [Microbotryomycetes sp. JL201]